MIVLDQDGVVQAHAVIGDAAGRRGGFFKNAQAGSGLAGVEDLAACALDGVDELAGERGYAAEALEEVEGDAFAGEQSAGASADSGDDVAIGCRRRHPA